MCDNLYICIKDINHYIRKIYNMKYETDEILYEKYNFKINNIK